MKYKNAVNYYTMKNSLLILPFFLLYFSTCLYAQVEHVTVETYYVADSNDATDTTAGRALIAGSKTFRVYVELKPGSKIKKIYGDSNHPLKISSTENFYNNIDRPAAYFGYLINKTWFEDNPTLSLDSWLTLGQATKTNTGILKPEDTDGSFIGGTNNTGGTAGIAGGLLINTDPSAGVPLTTSDGMIPWVPDAPTWINTGFIISSTGTDTTIFGSVNTGSCFESNNAFLQRTPGVTGPGNKVLIAQLTTAGDISFQLNLEIEEPYGASVNIVKYVANGDTLANDERVCPFLTYPPACGCTDPHYTEYNAGYACNIADSCRTLIVFGCMDSMACNYDPDANFNIPGLCCYPGYCNDRDISIVCPGVNINDERPAGFGLYPNPSQEEITISFSVEAPLPAKYVIYNSYGRAVLEKYIGNVSGKINQPVEISALETGLYLIRLYKGEESEAKMFMKN